MDELRGALEDLADKLQDAIRAAKYARKLANEQGGEIQRVVAGQLDAYLIGTLKAFVEDEHQCGSIASLNNFLDEKGE